MRLAIQDAPGELLFALLMAVSPIIGSFWVDPDVTRWTVFGVGCLMSLGVVLVALRPVKRQA
jgi:drug/metabolite transporter (DMT)-like permease